jgi:hypothetical protein
MLRAQHIFIWKEPDIALFKKSEEENNAVIFPKLSAAKH